jgi:hypothetical protein
MADDNYCDFTVVITKTGTNSGLVAECTSVDTEISINNVMQTDDVGAMKQINRFERSWLHYAGPDFQTLDERIQTALMEYFSGFGVDE